MVPLHSMAKIHGSSINFKRLSNSPALWGNKFSADENPRDVRKAHIPIVADLAQETYFSIASKKKLPGKRRIVDIFLMLDVPFYTLQRPHLCFRGQMRNCLRNSISFLSNPLQVASNDDPLIDNAISHLSNWSSIGSAGVHVFPIDRALFVPRIDRNFFRAHIGMLSYEGQGAFVEIFDCRDVFHVAEIIRECKSFPKSRKKSSAPREFLAYEAGKRLFP